MSIRESSKLEFLLRPCLPKLLDIPTSSRRYTRPEFLDDIVAGTPLPMVVDGELGMPLDLSCWDYLWEETGNDSELNPDPNNLPTLDPKDQSHLGDPASSSGSSMGSILFVTTQYDRLVMNRKHQPEATIDVSRTAQLRDIDASFAAIDNSELAVEVTDVLPDADIWANAYDLFRFSERSGDRPIDVRLSSFLHIGTRSLTYVCCRWKRLAWTEDEDAINFKKTRVWA
ncbi:hypothetical protein C8Q80DRAFT_1200491 [Daedaleopsis nitida]|nr:hypothetical protein C8Q80DRAFT_1200491 [Daedaleopsis nitida]